MPDNPTTLDEARRLVELAEKAPITPAFISQLCTALPRLAADYIAAVEERDAMRKVVDAAQKVIERWQEHGSAGFNSLSVLRDALAAAARPAGRGEGE